MDDSDDEVNKYHNSKIYLNNQSSDSNNSDTENNPTLTHDLIKFHLEEERRKREENSESSDNNSETHNENNHDSNTITTNSFGSNKIKDFRGDDKLGKMSRADQELAERARLEEALNKKRTIENMINLDQIDPELDEILQENNSDSDSESNDDQSNEKNDSSIKELESNLSNEEKIKLSNQKYPKLKNYINIYNQIISDHLPQVESNLQNKSSILTEILLEFLTVKRTFLLDFLTSLSFYFSVIFGEFKDEDGAILKGHPVMVRLKRFEKILEKYETEDDDFNILDGIIEGLDFEDQEGSDMVDGDNSDNNEIEEIKTIDPINDDKLTEILSKIEEKKRSNSEKLAKKKSKPKKNQIINPENNTNDSNNKRAITDQIAKNKGHILSKKKKIDRNPRVKNREKFRKAKVRQKGQVKPMRDRTHGYDGERGIRVGVTSDRKID